MQQIYTISHKRKLKAVSASADLKKISNFINDTYIMNDMQPDFPILVQTTFEKFDDASRMAELLIAEKLAACAQISSPIQSVYWWQGKVEQAQEVVLSIKTKKKLYCDVEQAITKHHPYKVPEILAVRIDEISPKYLHWLTSALNHE